MAVRSERWSGEATSTSWPRWIVSGAVIAFLLSSAIPATFRVGYAVEGTIDLGFSENWVVPFGLAMLVGTVLYAIPRTAMLGAVVLTGYFGGAIATDILNDGGWRTLTPVIVGGLIWIGLMLRDQRVGRLLFG